MPKKSKYSISPDGKILAGNQTVGHLHGDTGEYTLEIELPPSALMAVKAQIYDRAMSLRKSRILDKPVEQADSQQDIQSREEFSSYQPPPAPPAPAMDPKLGDKTPAYMSWMATYFPEQYRERYKGRKTHLTTGINPNIDAKGDVPESHFRKDPAEEWR